MTESAKNSTDPTEKSTVDSSGDAPDVIPNQSKPTDSQVTGSKANKSQATKAHPYPFYSPRFWHGMRPMTWWSMLRENRFRVSPTRTPLAIAITLATPFNTAMAGIQSLLHRKAIRQVQLAGPPVFIVGHWRSGTTMLHELLVRDSRFGSPSTYQCFAPHHFLISEWFFRTFGRWLLPGRRPMDNMAAGWERPQEDEFALMNLGQRSPYRRIAFPNTAPQDLHYLDFDSVDPAEQQLWVETLDRFLKNVTVACGKPLIVKSPTHTGRIATLAKAFPDAKFIHLTRDPRALFPSTVRLWSSLDAVQALQTQPSQTLDDYVIECHRHMYNGFHRHCDQLDSDRLIHVRYEDLVADPLETLQSIYETLSLADFESVRGDLTQWCDEEHRSYKTNVHDLPAKTLDRIRDAWKDYFQRYGYET